MIVNHYERWQRVREEVAAFIDYYGKDHPYVAEINTLFLADSGETLTHCEGCRHTFEDAEPRWCADCLGHKVSPTNPQEVVYAHSL